MGGVSFVGGVRVMDNEGVGNVACENKNTNAIIYQDSLINGTFFCPP